jgi:hypothetical protein
MFQINRFFKRPIHNDIAELVLKRCKSMLDYSESRPEFIHPPSLLHRFTLSLYAHTFLLHDSCRDFTVSYQGRRMVDGR